MSNGGPGKFISFASIYFDFTILHALYTRDYHKGSADRVNLCLRLAVSDGVRWLSSFCCHSSTCSRDTKRRRF